mgnify:CR=1 FL=1
MHDRHLRTLPPHAWATPPNDHPSVSIIAMLHRHPECAAAAALVCGSKLGTSRSEVCVVVGGGGDYTFIHLPLGSTLQRVVVVVVGGPQG